MRRFFAFVISIVMLMSICCVPAVAADTDSEEKLYDWDYELALERGYLTAEDNLPEGIVLNENEIFIPAEVPSPVHAQAALAFAAQNDISGNTGLSRANPASDPWKIYSWKYVGTVQSNTSLDAIIDAAGTVFFSTLFSFLGVSALINFTYSIYDMTASAASYIRNYGSLMGYYNKHMYTAKDPGEIPYVNYEIAYFYSNPARTQEYYIGTAKDWEFAVAP